MLAPTTSGRLGVHLLAVFIDAGWIIRTQGQRAVLTTPTGQHALLWVKAGAWQLRTADDGRRSRLVGGG
jgi:hypothetical protein